MFSKQRVSRRRHAAGHADGPDLTVWNAKAAYNALLAEFRKRPDVLFVCLTAPPLAPGKDGDARFGGVSLKGKGNCSSNEFDPAEGARLARQFNNWLCANGRLAEGLRPEKCRRL